MHNIIYDIETYPNVLTITFLDPKSGNAKTFEMSERKDDWQDFLEFVDKCCMNFVRWVGYNNFYFDYQVLHRLINHKPFAQMQDKAHFAYQVAQKIINFPKEERFKYIIWAHEHIIPQIDLFRIHHFDNVARSTSLKKLEFNMCSSTIADLPYAVGTRLNSEQIDELIRYNIHDCRETAKFYEKSLDMIRFREELSKKYNKNFLNHNDTKIGKDYFLMELERANIKCFDIRDGERVPVQTKRNIIFLKNIIFPYIEFERPEFQAVKEWLERQSIRETKGVFTGIENLGSLEQYSNLTTVKGKVKNLNCIVDGFQFDFGTGGIHGSVESTIVEETDDFAIIDYDVTSLYPSIAIANRVFPEHMTEKFCDIYEQVRKDRLSYPKGSPENAMLKLALNGVYGDSNNKFSAFYDPQYTMTITINGQLMLCMLAEKMMGVEGVSLIQINTDGVTIKVPRHRISEIEEINKEWEKLTGLALERADYSRMFIRDVNNYIGEYTDGKVKRKGAYEYEMAWHQNHSALIVQKAAEAHLLRGENIEDFIKNHDNDHDFMLRTNVPRTSYLLIEYDNNAHQLQNTTRYYMCKTGGQLVKVMPPLKQTSSMAQLEERAKRPAEKRDFEILRKRREKLGVKDRERTININDGYKVAVANTIYGKIKDINYDWYIGETRKLVDPLWKGAYTDLMS